MYLLGVLSTVLINEYAVLCFQQFVLGARSRLSICVVDGDAVVKVKGRGERILPTSVLNPTYILILSTAGLSP